MPKRRRPKSTRRPIDGNARSHPMRPISIVRNWNAPSKGLDVGTRFYGAACKLAGMTEWEGIVERGEAALVVWKPQLRAEVASNDEGKTHQPDFQDRRTLIPAAGSVPPHAQGVPRRDLVGGHAPWASLAGRGRPGPGVLLDAASCLSDRATAEPGQGVLFVAIGYGRDRQIAHHSLKALLIGVVIFPAPEVADKARPELRCPRLIRLHDRLVEADGKQHDLPTSLLIECLDRISSISIEVKPCTIPI